MIRRHLLRDRRGVSATEFALAAPVMLSMVIGVSQFGTLFFANSGIQHAVEEAARVASVYPQPPNAQILAAFDQARFGMKGTLTPSLIEGTSNDGMRVLDISVSYAVPLDFIFFSTPPVRLTHSRRVFLQLPTPPSSTSSSSTSASSASTSSTSSGGATSTSTSSTSGGTTTSASTSSTTTSSTGGSNASSGNSNGSSGNGNGSSGNCKKNC